MAQIARRKIFGRTRSKDLSSDDHSVRSNNDFSVDLLGAEAIFKVEENSYLRDKLAYGLSLGIAGKKTISHNSNLADVKAGTCWNTRILIVRASSICLCAVQNSPNTHIHLGPKKGKSQETPSSYQEELLQMAGKVETSIMLEDIDDVLEYDKEQLQLQINTLEPTGYSDNVIIRARNSRDYEKLQSVLKNRYKAYDLAIKRMWDGREMETDETSSKFQQAHIFLLTKQIPGDVEVSLKHMVKWGDKVNVGEILPEKKIMAYLKFHSHNYKAVISEFHIKMAEKDEVWVRADPILLDNEDTIEEKDQTETYMEYNVKPISLRIESNWLQSKRELLQHQKSEKVNENVEKNLLNEKTEVISKENAHLLLLCVGFMLSILIPEEYVNRATMLGVLLGLLLSVFMLEKAKRSSTTTGVGTAKVVQPFNDTAGKRSSIVTEKNVWLTFVDFDPSLKYNILDLDEDEKSLGEKRAKRQRLKLQAQNTVRDLSQSKLGVDALISALCGAFDDSLRDEDVPQKWIDATDTREQAIFQWRGALKWRREYDIDNILDVPQPHYEEIKSLSVYGWLGLDNEQSLVVLQKLSHEFKQSIEKFRELGVTPQMFAAQSVFLNEYWIKNRLSPTGRICHILDLKGFALSTVSKGVIDYLMPMNRCMQQYPELLLHVYVINAPNSFRWIWRIISPFLAKKTTEKFQVIPDKKIKERLSAIIPVDLLPAEYGGNNETPLYESPFEKQLLEFVREVNAKAAQNERSLLKLDA